MRVGETDNLLVNCVGHVDEGLLGHNDFTCEYVSASDQAIPLAWQL